MIYSNKNVTAGMQLLPAGRHDVKITSIIKTDSFTNDDGSDSSKQPKYADATPQFLLTLENKKGRIRTRTTLRGYFQFEDLPEKLQNKDFIDSEDGYAIIQLKAAESLIEKFKHDEFNEMAKNEMIDILAEMEQIEAPADTWIRIPHESNLKSCLGYLDQLARSAGFEEGQDLSEIYDDDLLLNKEISVEVYQKSFVRKNGDPGSRYDVRAFRTAGFVDEPEKQQKAAESILENALDDDF